VRIGKVFQVVLVAHVSPLNSRLGQTKDVHIYKLTIAETVEERILKVSRIGYPVQCSTQ
jgi:hypothetical protein